MFEGEQALINGLFDLTQEYAKKHGLSYILGCGKMANKTFFTGDIYHEATQNEVFYICQALIRDNALGRGISAAILKADKEFLQTYRKTEAMMKDQ